MVSSGGDEQANNKLFAPLEEGVAKSTQTGEHSNGREFFPEKNSKIKRLLGPDVGVTTTPVVGDHDGGRVRFGVAFLGLMIAVANCYAQATFCIAIVEMVLPSDYSVGPSSNTSLPAPSSPNSAGPQDDSCPIEWRYRHFYDRWRLSTFAASVNLSEPTFSSGHAQLARPQPKQLEDRFQWDANRQGLLLGAYAIGAAPLQIVGGRLAETHGAKWVLLAGSVGTCVTNLAVPWLARLSFPLLLVDRVLMGVAQAGMEPGLMCLLADWLAPSETGFFISMSLFAICCGFFLGSLCSSFVLSLGLGWPAAFYLAGVANLLVSLVWLVYASSWPRSSARITPTELSYIQRQQVSHQSHHSHHSGPHSSPPAAPWGRILSSGPVWAFICCKISVRWCADVLSMELPTYLANVLHLSIELNGLLNSVSSALFALFSFLAGYLASRLLVAQRGAAPPDAHQAKTRLRKCVQSVASFGSSGLLFLMSHHDCDLVASVSALLLLSCCIVMGTGGELQIPYDMTARYPGTLHGLACTLSVSGWLAPPLVGLLLGERPASRHRWQLIWHLTALITLLGGLVFVLFGDASPRDFDAPSDRSGPFRRQATPPSAGPSTGVGPVGGAHWCSMRPLCPRPAGGASQTPGAPSEARPAHARARSGSLGRLVARPPEATSRRHSSLRAPAGRHKCHLLGPRSVGRPAAAPKTITHL